MGTLIFVILKIFKVFDTDFDWPIGCGLVSLDSIALGLFSLGSTVRSCWPGVGGGDGAGEETRVSSEDETKTESS
jgi:hypothetical protein